MKILEGIQALASQTMTTTIDNGDSIEITLRFNPSTKMWFMDLVYDEFELYSQRIYNAPNILTQYIKILPFGININVTDGTEPYLINDFSSERVLIGILTPDEVTQIEDSYKEAKDS